MVDIALVVLAVAASVLVDFSLWLLLAVILWYAGKLDFNLGDIDKE